MNKKIVIAGLFGLFTFLGTAQVSFVINGTYSQTFGSSTISSWTDNSTFTGWYAEFGDNYPSGTSTALVAHLNITGTAPSNTGGLFAYQCSSNNDNKIGFRPSNGSGGGPCDATPITCGGDFGLYMVNTSTITVQAIRVTFDWFQLSVAQDNGTANTNYFYYQVVNALPSPYPLISGSWTNVVALNYTAPQTCGCSCSPCNNQISGQPCNLTSNVSACIPVTISPGQGIMLRWHDPNNANNDPHIAIDNVNITAYEENACIIILPVTFKSVYSLPANDGLTVFWSIEESEKIERFEIERSENGMFFKTIGSLYSVKNQNFYSYFDKIYKPGGYYYRIKGIEKGGNELFSSVIFEEVSEKQTIVFQNSEGDFVLSENFKGQVTIIDFLGREIKTEYVPNASNPNRILSKELSIGHYWVRLVSENEIRTFHFSKN